MDVLKGELNSTSTYVPAHLTKDNLLLHHIDPLTKIDVKMDKCELPTLYWLPKLHKKPYKSRFISNSSDCSTTVLSKHIPSALTAVKQHVIKYSETALSNSNVNYVWLKKLCWGHQKATSKLSRFSSILLFLFKNLIATRSHQSKSDVSCKRLFQQRVQTHFCTSNKAGFLATRSTTRINVGLALTYVKHLFSSWKTYVQSEGMVYQQIVGIPTGTDRHKLCITHSGFIFILLWDGFYV